jgi:hypothetical protein
MSQGVTVQPDRFRAAPSEPKRQRLGRDIEQLADELTELFGQPVDLVSLHALHPLLQPSVLAEAQAHQCSVTSSCSPR